MIKRREEAQAMQAHVRSYSNDVGDATLTDYDLFPGVRLSYCSVHMDRLDIGDAAQGDLIEIHHCREGRIEQEFEDHFFYLTPGDLSIAIRTHAVKAFSFPLRHYHGVTITIDTRVAPACFSALLDDVQVQPMEVARKLCGDRQCHIIRGERYVEHIFSELYSVPENIRAGYMKLKVLELLLVLHGLNPAPRPEDEIALSRFQVQLAKRAAAHLSAHMDRHITIAALARHFNVSETHLKLAFKGVFGVPIFSYMRIQRMQMAAQLLIHSDRSIADVAAESGYENSGKFSAAFREITGESPSGYRRAHSKRVKSR